MGGLLIPNEKGKYKKSDILLHGYEIVDYGLTASEIRKQYGITIPEELRLELAIGFKTGKGWRGYSPVYDIYKIQTLKFTGML